MNNVCISAEEYEAVFVLFDIAVFLRDILKGDSDRELRYLEHIVYEIGKVREDVDETKII